MHFGLAPRESLSIFHSCYAFSWKHYHPCRRSLILQAFGADCSNHPTILLDHSSIASAIRQVQTLVVFLVLCQALFEMQVRTVSCKRILGPIDGFCSFRSRLRRRTALLAPSTTRSLIVTPQEERISASMALPTSETLLGFFSIEDVAIDGSDVPGAGDEQGSSSDDGGA